MSVHLSEYFKKPGERDFDLQINIENRRERSHPFRMGLEEANGQPYVAARCVLFCCHFESASYSA